MTRLLTPRGGAVAAVALLLAGSLVGCSGGSEPSADPTSPATTSSTEASASSAATPTTPPAPAVPGARDCYRLDRDEAVAPTASVDPVPCARRHTAMTFAVGDLDTLVGGHLLAVDSARVGEQVAQECPRRFERFVGGTPEDRQLSMLRPVWFTPTVEESDAGASWYRCDVVAIAGSDELADLSGRLAGALGRPEQRDRYAMCGTAQPGTDAFERVICSADHSWRAVEVVPFDGDDYPGEPKVRAAGEDPCQDAGAEAAGGALDYRWGYEWPTAEQWRSGQHYGICWAPD